MQLRIFHNTLVLGNYRIETFNETYNYSFCRHHPNLIHYHILIPISSILMVVESPQFSSFSSLSLRIAKNNNKCLLFCLFVFCLLVLCTQINNPNFDYDQHIIAVLESYGQFDVFSVSR